MGTPCSHFLSQPTDLRAGLEEAFSRPFRKDRTMSWIFSSPLRVVLPLDEPKGLSLLEKLSQEQTHAIRRSCVGCHYLWVSYATPMHLRALAGHPAPHPIPAMQSSSLRLEPVRMLENSGKPPRGPAYWYRHTLAFPRHQPLFPFGGMKFIS